MKAYQLLDSPEKWMQNPGSICSAKESNGLNCDDLSSQAVSWCILGALKRCYGTDYSGSIKKVLRCLGKKFSHELAPWNDAPGRKWEEVRAVLKEADV